MVISDSYPDIYDIKIKISMDDQISIDLNKKIERFLNAWKTVAGDKCKYFKKETDGSTSKYRAIFEVEYTHFDDTTIFSLGKEVEAWGGPAFISLITSNSIGDMEHNLYGKCNVTISSVSNDDPAEDYYVLVAPSHGVCINTDSVRDIIGGKIPKGENESQKAVREMFLRNRRFSEWSREYLNLLMPTDNLRYLSGESCYDEEEGFSTVGLWFDIFADKITIPDSMKFLQAEIDAARQEKKIIEENSCFKIDWFFGDNYYAGMDTSSNEVFKSIMNGNNEVKYIGYSDQNIFRIQISENEEKFEVLRLE